MGIENVFGAGVLGVAQASTNALLTERNAELQRELYDYTAKQAYMYGERSADRADLRTRLLYQDLYSPQAQMQQIKDAGLSPSLFYGDMAGMSGQSGAQGTGAAGAQTNAFGINPIDLAQINALNAQANKSEAEAKNISQDTILKKFEEKYKTLELGQYDTEWNILNSNWTDPQTGKETSIYELADKHYSYDSFLNSIRTEQTDESIKLATTTEAGQKILRSIYYAASKMNRDISTLASEQVNANFQLSIIEKLKDKGFQDLNAEAAVQELRTQISTNELTESQKQAWNNLLDRLGKKGSSLRDITIVLGMILGNFAKNSNVRINTGGQVLNFNKTGGE